MSRNALAALCDHLDVRVVNRARARDFYEPFCAALGLTVVYAGENWTCFETHDASDVFLAIDEDPSFVPSRTRVAFRADSRADVDRIAAAAQAAGAREYEAPHACPEYTEGYYAAFFCDPDGNRYEICYRPVSARLRTIAEFSDALIADAPASGLGERANDLAWLIGGWSAVVRDYEADGSHRESTGEWWFSWVLQGRAMQDVWMVPERGNAASPRSRYGSTIRRFDRETDVWKISWFNPVTGAHNELAQCAGQPGRLVFEGDAGGQRIRWSFNDVTADGFVWRGESLDAHGTASLGSEFVLTRIA